MMRPILMVPCACAGARLNSAAAATLASPMRDFRIDSPPVIRTRLACTFSGNGNCRRDPRQIGQDLSQTSKVAAALTKRLASTWQQCPVLPLVAVCRVLPRQALYAKDDSRAIRD